MTIKRQRSNIARFDEIYLASEFSFDNVSEAKRIIDLFKFSQLPESFVEHDRNGVG